MHTTSFVYKMICVTKETAHHKSNMLDVVMYFVVGERTAAAPNACISIDTGKKEETEKHSLKCYFDFQMLKNLQSVFPYSRLLNISFCPVCIALLTYFLYC